MKLDAPKRRIVHDVIDLIPSSSDVDKDAANHVVEIPISWIQPYHNHLFRLYEGDRLNDMVESIKKNGVLTPVIVLRLDENHYEMLFVHDIGWCGWNTGFIQKSELGITDYKLCYFWIVLDY